MSLQEREVTPVRAPADGRGERDFSMPASLADAYHNGAVTAVARRICGPDHADDVTQDVFVGLWSHPEKFDPARGSLRPLLLLLAHHKAIDVVRSETARLAREQKVGAEIKVMPAKVEGGLPGAEAAASKATFRNAVVLIAMALASGGSPVR